MVALLYMGLTAWVGLVLWIRHEERIRGEKLRGETSTSKPSPCSHAVDRRRALLRGCASVWLIGLLGSLYFSIGFQPFLTLCSILGTLSVLMLLASLHTLRYEVCPADCEGEGRE